jgi:hypothetical protein
LVQFRFGCLTRPLRDKMLLRFFFVHFTSGLVFIINSLPIFLSERINVADVGACQDSADKIVSK